MVRNKTLLCLFLFSSIQSAIGQGRVYNGDNLDPEKNKHLVKILPTENGYTYGLCSGSIISDRWILTAAHCVQNYKGITIQHQKDNDMYKIAEAKDYFMKDPSFDRNPPLDHFYENSEKDLALILTADTIQFNDHIQPIKLAARRIKVGRSGLISGFGEVSPNVFETRQGVVLIKKCPSKKKTSMICSRGIVGGGSGDSGGSLVYKRKLAGVLSWVYTDNSSNYRWTGYVSIADNLQWVSKVINS